MSFLSRPLAVGRNRLFTAYHILTRMRTSGSLVGAPESLRPSNWEMAARRYSSKAARRTIQDRTGQPTTKDNYQLTEIYLAPGARSAASMKRVATVFLLLTVGFAPAMYYFQLAPPGVAVLAGCASVAPLFLLYFINRNLVSRVWLLSDAKGQLPTIVRDAFITRASQSRHRLFPEQMVAVEIYSLIGKASVFVLAVRQFKLGGIGEVYERWVPRTKVDQNDKPIPGYLRLHTEVVARNPSMKVLREQIAACENGATGKQKA
ncbi:hypothetical protein IWQ60_005263 [Tieghemiomyces parasiticus]|uniref:Uncharacterized protein n=1 Tax=Tieghemiomyces parasiticus TaxID=78921 RepID=A0A9W8ACQ1_9FUNG|nr:hypothetical protein IWQ60_005263 [Tieghemiomyces parasiticus]